MRPAPLLRRIAFSVALVLGTPQLGWADDADALIAHGVTLREQGKDEEALTEFRRAFAIAPTPKARAQLALAEQALGLWVPAEEHLSGALKEAQDPWIARNRSPLAQSLRVVEQHLGTLMLRGGIDGADVLVDGSKVGVLPLPSSGLRVESGRRSLEVRADGYYPVSRNVVVVPGEIARETLELTARKPDASAPREEQPDRPPSDNGAALLPAHGGRDLAGSGTAHADPGAVQRATGWVLLATGGAFLATAVVAQIVRQGQISAYNDDASCPGVGKPNQPEACAGRISSANTWQTVSILGLVTGGALAVGGVVLVVTAPAKAGTPAAVAVSGRF